MKHRRGIDLAGAAEELPYQALPTFDSFPEYVELGGRCSKCEREGWVDRWELQRRFGVRTYINQIRPLLRCRKCGNKGSNNWILRRAPR
uniref:hypothetical protein n=1 Tax=Sinorhizobium sp. LM21 TaxID=1449788 RepID=UPI001FEE177C|nr:hypothetical protein [Sinorhizobium sp. LM21]